MSFRRIRRFERTGGRELYELDDAMRAWKLQHPNGARP